MAALLRETRLQVSSGSMPVWRFKRNEKVLGPFNEEQIRVFLEKHELLEGDVVQSDESPWRDASLVRKMFRDLIEFGWYVQRQDKSVGPFTPARLLDLRGDALITKNTLVRQGPRGSWMSFADAHPAILQLVQAAASQKPSATETAPTPREPVGPFVIATEVQAVANPMSAAAPDTTFNTGILPTVSLADATKPSLPGKPDGSALPVQIVETPRERRPRVAASKNKQWLVKHFPYVISAVLLLAVLGIIVTAYSPVATVGNALGEVRRSSVVTSIIARPEYAIEELVSRTSPSVALIDAAPAFGTGFMVDSQLMITNYHVVADAEASSIEVVFPDGNPGSEGPFTAAVIAESPSRDLALLKLPQAIPAVEIDETHQFRRGQEIIIIGSPGVFEGRDVLPNAVTQGVLSSQVSIDGFNNYQLSAAVNPGNSGGPVFGRDGRVIGVVTMKSISEESIAFCIPAEEVAAFVRDNKAMASSDTMLVRSRHNARRAMRVLLDQTAQRALIVQAIAQRLRSSGVELSRVAMRDLQDGQTALTGENGVLRQYDLSEEFGYLAESPSLSSHEKLIVTKVFAIYRRTNQLLLEPPDYFEQFSQQIDQQSDQLIDALVQLNASLDIGRSELRGE